MTALIDACAWVGAHPRAYVDDHTAAGLAATMRRLDIAAAMVGATAAVWHDPVGGNDEALAAATHHGLFPCFTLVGSTPEESDPPALVAEAVAAGVVGFRMAPSTHGFDPTDAALDPTYDALVSTGRPLTIDADIGPANLDALAARWPRLTLIVSSIGYRALRTIAPLFARRPNLHADTVNFATHEGFEWFARQYGAERLLFATGAPFRDPAEAVGRLMWSGLTDADRELVGHANAERLFPGVVAHVG
ncbi:amidohydrolase family protein [Tenggerimyces flavus]|uniref:Amidohydrolase family protein n=1 Tax=Tenggerimyces flavus TaxID=1708749 RepID=A0ABV7YKA7_9ACTN|nr:amidohydrolase family protein [Tenggerimyces flavus]MBM7789815.1 hypothetical protein [Tenggerimyces flavus]